MTEPTTHSLELRFTNSTGLRVVFERREDRWRHAIEALVDGAYTRLLESVEGSATDAWPASPPLQHLHFEDRGDNKRVALAVGMAGRSHWSASIETDPGKEQLFFDIACRASAKPEILGATYRVTGRERPLIVDNKVQVRADHEGTVLRISSESIMSVTDDLVVLVPARMPMSIPGTARWQYLLALDLMD